jgi:ariadne-1
VVDDLTVMTLISDPRVKLKYQHLITNSFVQCNRLLRWCPSPDCSNAIKVSGLYCKALDVQYLIVESAYTGITVLLLLLHSG